MQDKRLSTKAGDLAAATGRALGRAARSGRQQLETFLGGRDRLRVIFLLAAVLALGGADAATVGASAIELRQALKISNADIGVLVAVTSVVAAVASIPFGVLADKAPRTRTLGLAIFLWGAAMLWSASAASFGRLLLARMFLGVVTAAAGPMVASLVGDLFGGEERGRIYGYILTGEMLGAGIGFAVTGDVAALSWRAAFVILAIPAFVLAYFVFQLPEPDRTGGSVRPAGGPHPSRNAPPDGGPHPSRNAGGNRGAASPPAGLWAPPAGDSPRRADQSGYPTQPMVWPAAAPTAPVPGDPASIDVQRLARERGIRPHPEQAAQDPERMGFVEAARYVLKVRTNVILMVAGACGYFFLAGIQTFGVEFVRQQYRTSAPVANLLMLVIGAGAIAGVLAGGSLGDALLRRRYLNGRILVAALAASLSVVLFVPALATRSLLTAIPYVTFAAFFLSAQNAPMDAARLDIMPAPLWGRAEGIRSMIRTGAQALAPLLFGFGSDVLGGGRGGLQWTFLVMLIPLAIGAVITFRAMRTYPRDVATAGRGSRH